MHILEDCQKFLSERLNRIVALNLELAFQNNPFHQFELLQPSPCISLNQRKTNS